VIALKTPICSFDAKTGVLCAKCESRVDSGQLKSSDVEGAMKLAKLAEHDQNINQFTLLGATKVDDIFVLIMKSPDIVVIRGNSNIAKKIKTEFQSKVWFVEGDSSDRKFIENLFFPAKVLNVNLIWLPDGNKVTKVIVEQNGNAGSQLDSKNIQEIAKTVKNMELVIEVKNSNIGV
jgi:transcription antitermination factor NusA-like protein